MFNILPKKRKLQLLRCITYLIECRIKTASYLSIFKLHFDAGITSEGENGLYDARGGPNGISTSCYSIVSK